MLFLVAVSLLHITGKAMISDQFLLKVVGLLLKCNNQLVMASQPCFHAGLLWWKNGNGMLELSIGGFGSSNLHT